MIVKQGAARMSVNTREKIILNTNKYCNESIKYEDTNNMEDYKLYRKKLKLRA